MLPALSAACFLLALTLMIKRPSWRRTQAVLMLIAGLALAGSAGQVRARLTDLGTSTTASLTTKVLGIGLAYGFALVIVVWWMLDMDLDGLINKARRKGGGSGRHSTTAATPWVALLVPVSIAALPVIGGLTAQATVVGDQLAALLLGG